MGLSALNRSCIGRSGCQYYEHCLGHCMSPAVILQHNGTQELRGCMSMQSTTWPWRAGVSGCRQSNVLRVYRIETVRGKLFAIRCLQSQQQWASRSRASPSIKQANRSVIEHCQSERQWSPMSPETTYQKIRNAPAATSVHHIVQVSR